MNHHFRFRVAEHSHTGRVRTVNEDARLIRDECGLWAVADGMGGHENGQWASETVIAALEATDTGGEIELGGDAICAGLHQANAAINDAADRAGKTMGSTAVVLLVRDQRFACFWVGDSRAYLLRGGQLVQLTEDHTQVQDLVSRGLLSPEEAAGHPLSNVISRAVGVTPRLEIDAISDEVRPRDVFLLCSDGLTGLVEPQEIESRLNGLQPASAAQELLDLALERGGPDNITLVLVACEERTAIMSGAGS